MYFNYKFLLTETEAEWNILAHQYPRLICYIIGTCAHYSVENFEFEFKLNFQAFFEGV